MLTQSQKSDIRRHLGYPTLQLSRQSNGMGSLGMASDYMNYQSFVPIDQKLDNLPAEAEARLTGDVYGTIALMGLPPEAGDQIDLDIVCDDLTPVLNESIQVVAVEGDTQQSLIQKLAIAVLQNSTLATNKFVAFAADVPSETMGGRAPLAEVAIRAPLPFTMGLSPTGNIGAAITHEAINLEPTATVGALNGLPLVKYGYLQILGYLEGAHAGATQNLDTIKADVWTGRMDEVAQRKRLYEEWVQNLSGFLGIPCVRKARSGRAIL